MKTTVVVTTYNGSKFLVEQMDSILAQTKQPDEVILSDDGSSDNTVDLVNKFIEDNSLESLWRIQINEHNKGYAKNFIDTSLIAKNEVVFFCDQDDIWVKNRLQVMLDVMENNNDINLLCSNLEPFYYEEDTRKWDNKILKEMINDGSLERHSLDFENFHLKRSGCTMCIRKSYMESIAPYWIDGWPHDDFVWKMAVASNSCAILQYNSVMRRMHSNNTSVLKIRTREWRINQLSELKKQYQSLEKYIKSLGEDVKQTKVVQHNIDSLNIRKNVVANKYIWKWFILLTNYKDCYPRRKGLYLDLYLAIFKKYKGAN